MGKHPIEKKKEKSLTMCFNVRNCRNCLPEWRNCINFEPVFHQDCTDMAFKAFETVYL